MVFGMTESSPAERLLRPARVQSVGRALRIIDLLGEPQHQSGLGLAQIAQFLDLSKSATHALLDTLKQYGFVTRVQPGPRFLLGMSLMRLGEQVRRQMPLTDAAHPYLRSLATETGWTARLVVADHGFPLYVSRVEGVGAVQFSARIGRRERPHSTGVGKAILASLSDEDALAVVRLEGMERRTPHTITNPDDLITELDQIRADGYAVDREEDTEGILCVAASVRDASGHCVGAISTSGLVTVLTPDRIDGLGATVRDHADRLSASL